MKKNCPLHSHNEYETRMACVICFRAKWQVRFVSPFPFEAHCVCVREMALTLHKTYIQSFFYYTAACQPLYSRTHYLLPTPLCAVSFSASSSSLVPVEFNFAFSAWKFFAQLFHSNLFFFSLHNFLFINFAQSRFFFSLSLFFVIWYI